MTVRLADVVAVLEELYPPAWAQEWDAVGLVCGDPDAPVRRVLLAVDPVQPVVQEAVDGGFDLLLSHHPLYLRGTASVAATSPKGRVVHALVRGGCALHVAHTNADAADPGVSDALAERFRLRDLRPLQPAPAEPLDKLVTYVPVALAERMLDALSAAGAGTIGDYERCAWTTTGTGTFRPLPGAAPAVGEVGRVEQVEEARLEVVLPRVRRAHVLAAMRAAHPYEEPAYDVLELAGVPGPRGLGRVGELPEPTTLAELAEHAAAVLPATAWGVRAAGDPDQEVRTLAVCGGSGDSLLREAGRAADAYLTADLRHHPASEAPEGLGLIDAAHWATEHPWLADAARRLSAATTVETVVSDRVTDPWTHAVRSPRWARSPRVKADPFVQLRLLELQALDSSLDRLAHRRRTLPELAEMTRLDGLVDALRDGIVRAETEVSDLAREQARFEKEIEQVRARRDRDETRLASGSITASKQLQDLEHEVVSLKRRQSDLEDSELEVMERAETAQAGLSELTTQREAHLSARAEAESAAAAATADIDAEVEKATTARAELAATLPADLLALYEKIRAAEGGIGAGEIARGRCGGCRLDLMNNEKSEFRAAPPDEVLRHEECGRILVRTAESGL